MKSGKKLEKKSKKTLKKKKLSENVKFFCNIFSKKFLTLFTCYSLFIMT